MRPLGSALCISKSTPSSISHSHISRSGQLAHHIPFEAIEQCPYPGPVSYAARTLRSELSI